MIRRLGLAAASVALCLGGMVAFPGAANAASPPCPTGYACMWKDIHYVTNGNSGDYFRMFYYVKDLRRAFYPGTTVTVFKSISSEYNAGTGGDPVFYFKGLNCSGASFSSAAGTGDSDLTNGTPPGNFNDAIESASFMSQLSNCRN